MTNAIESSKLYKQLKSFYDEQMEKKIQLHQILWQKENIYKVARLRESCAWELFMGASTAAILGSAAQISGNRYYAIPILPVVMFVGYRFDSAFGSNVGKVKDAAEAIPESQVTLIGPPITLAELDRRRSAWNNKTIV